MKSFRYILPCLFLILVSCKKDELDGGYEILQGKWKWIGSTETRINKLTGEESNQWIPASNYSRRFFLEFERKGLLSLWENESEVKFYRVQKVWDSDDCNSYENCKDISINLNFDPNRFITFYMNEDSMNVYTVHLNVPLSAYSDNAANYTYTHKYVRIN